MNRVPKNIVSVILWERGSQGYEEPFDSNKSVEEYIEYFKRKTKEDNNARYPIVFYIQKTFKKEDGSDLVDEKGDRITETLYLNKDVISNLAHP